MKEGYIIRDQGAIYYSSAAYYVGLKGVVDIELPSNPIIDATRKGYHMDIENW